MARKRSPVINELVRGARRMPTRRSRLACGKARVHYETKVVSDPMASDTSPRPEKRVLDNI